MKKIIIVLFFLSLVNNFLYSQSPNKDSLQTDTIVGFQKDSLLKPLKTINDPIVIGNSNTDLIHETNIVLNEDTIKWSNEHDVVIEDDRIKNNELPDSVYLNYYTNISDSLIFEKADSVYFVIDQFEKELDNSSFFINDTIVRSIKKLIEYRRNINAKKAIEYLQKSIDNNRIFIKTDSVQTAYNDSLKRTIEYILNSIPEDTLKLVFTNLGNDTLQFNNNESAIDSIHFKLYDNRGEVGIMWIKKLDKNLFSFELEDGVFLEKIKQQSAISKGIDSEIKLPELMKVEKVNLIIPIWKFEGNADVKFNQGHISPTWAEGGESSLSLLSVLKYNVNYTYGKKRNFDFDFEYRLGYLKAGENDLQKNDDRLELNFKYGRSAFSNWYYSSLLNIKTQILKGYEYVNDTTVVAISEFFSPASIVFSLGLDYKPSKKLTVLISPITSKFTIVADTTNYDQTRFGLKNDERVRKELGAYIKAISKIKILDNISIENKVNFFTNYVDNPQNIDIDWETDIAVKLTDYIKISVNAHLIYDDNVAFIEEGVEKGPRVQFKELFGIGFTYTF